MIKNAFAYVTRKSLKSIIILLVIMAMSTLSLISLAIKDATNRASEETFKNITNSFSMEINRRVNLGTPRGGGNIKGKDPGINKEPYTGLIDTNRTVERSLSIHESRNLKQARSYTTRMLTCYASIALATPSRDIVVIISCC